MAKSHQEVELDSIIIASHLARYVPTSLSLDNLHFLYNENTCHRFSGFIGDTSGNFMAVCFWGGQS